MEVLSKITKILNQDSPCPIQDSNIELLEHKSEALQLGKA
jgi:hypothetical protein